MRKGWRFKMAWIENVINILAFPEWPIYGGGPFRSNENLSWIDDCRVRSGHVVCHLVHRTLHHNAIG